VREAAAFGVPMPSLITLGAREPGLPWALEGATDLGVTIDDWYLWAGDGDDLQRLVWFCFPPGARSPRWVVKTTRVAGYDDPFDRDEAGLALLAAVPPSVRSHAPTIVARYSVEDRPASIETIAPGLPLHAVIGADERGDTALVSRIARWIIELGLATAQPPSALEPERERLALTVVPAWAELDPPTDLVARIPAVAPVVQHNDLGCWNILTAGDDFTVVDWESARPAGLPLWDLAYFLTDAFAAIATRGAAGDRLTAMLALLRGELPHSARVFELLLDGAAALGVPRPGIAPIVTLGWLHHGLSAAARGATASRRRVTAAGAADAPLQRLAARWLADPQLGPAWPALDKT
jgi:hypothetical protein